MKGRPKKPQEEKRRQIKVYVSPETEKQLRGSLGLKKLGHWLDDNANHIHGMTQDDINELLSED
jgi:hypothetical protein